MSRVIIKLTDPETNKDYYLDWSTAVDAPITNGMDLEHFKDYYRQEYGRSGMEDLAYRLERVEITGTSLISRKTVDELLVGNNAGDNETLTKQEIIKKYCTDIKHT